MDRYDIVTVGGGVGGSAIAKALAEQGYRVLVVEREPRFKDRVRGEFMFPWGVAEAKALGVYDVLLQAGGHHPTYWADYMGPHPLPPRNLAETTPQQVHALCLYHPRMQEALLAAAEAAGAEVRRGVRVVHVEPGAEAQVRLQGDGAQTVAAKFVIGADGRASMTRKWCGFDIREAPTGNALTGVLIENVPASADSIISMVNPGSGRSVAYAPQTQNSGRAYLGSRAEDAVGLHGSSDFDRFLEECRNGGLAEGLFDGATQAGPLATFDTKESWVEHPYRNSCALIGDAAGTTDACWGQGLSLTLRDARVLRDALLADEDWEAAGHAYAAEHDRYFPLVRTASSWLTTLFLEKGAEADEIRARVFPQLKIDPSILPDTLHSGPDAAPPTEEQRARIFGEGVSALPA